MTDPLTPPDCDLRDFPRMMIDIPRLRASAFDSTPDDSAWRAALNLWMSSWHGDPAASLEADDASLCKAAGLGRDLKTWRKIKDTALRGWSLCSDGRFYHATVAEFALEAWLEKLAQRLSSGAGNSKRWGTAFDPEPIEADIGTAVALLTALNPASKAIPKSSRRMSRRDPVGIPDVIPSGSQETETGTGNTKKEGGADAPAPSSPIDPEKKAWADAVELLTTAGGMKSGPARSFIGKLKSDHGIEAKDLLPAIGQAIATQTQDPAAYLRKAAEGIGKRRGGGAPSPITDTTDERDLWPRRIKGWNESRTWIESLWGPPPGRHGSRVPASMLEAKS